MERELKAPYEPKEDKYLSDDQIRKVERSNIQLTDEIKVKICYYFFIKLKKDLNTQIKF